MLKPFWNCTGLLRHTSPGASSARLLSYYLPFSATQFILLYPFCILEVCWNLWSGHQFSSVAQSCPTLCDPMNRSMPGLPVHHQHPEFTQTRASSRWWHPAISSSVVPFSSCPQSLPASGSFPVSQLFTWSGQSIGVWALASVLPMNTQDWSPLGWTRWISLQSKGLSRVFSNTTVQKHRFFGGAQL